MFSIIALIIACILLSFVLASKVGEFLSDRSYDPEAYRCPECHSDLSYDEWENGCCRSCFWDATEALIEKLRKNNEHAAADWVEGLNTVAARHYAEMEGELDPQAYCRCGAHVNSVRCFTPAITTDSRGEE